MNSKQGPVKNCNNYLETVNHLVKTIDRCVELITNCAKLSKTCIERAVQNLTITIVGTLKERIAH